MGNILGQQAEILHVFMVTTKMKWRATKVESPKDYSSSPLYKRA